MAWMIPGGKEKGVVLADASDDALEYWEARIADGLKQGTARKPEQDTSLLQAIRDEISRRQPIPEAKKENAPQPPPQAENHGNTIEPVTSIVPSQPTATRITGTSRDTVEVTRRLQMAAKTFHLVSPAPACPRLPEGCSIALSAVLIDAKVDCYPVPGGLALTKSALEKIGAAAGISWDAHQSGRTDDGSDPHYCAWRAVGVMRQFDGTEIQVMASKEMDLRDGSAQVEAIRANKKEGKDPSNQIRELRAHIMAHAESKAKLRAIRSLGLRAAYKAEDLQKPFVVARLVWTGETDDPELRRAFALRQADSMLGGARALYGDIPVAPRVRPAITPEPPPPVGTVKDDELW
jgi:hypothetical protein